MKNPVAYIERTRDYYGAQGFASAYRYAQHDSAAFVQLPKPLSECRVGLVTTASAYHREDLEPRKVSSISALQPPEKLFTSDLSWDKQATHTDDVQSFCPITPLNNAAKQGLVSSLAPTVVCAPTEYSHRATKMDDAPLVHEMLMKDEVDVVVLVPL